MTKRPHWFVSCMECESTAPNHSGICPACEREHGYGALVDDVDPAARPPLPLRLVKENARG
jgi:predicted ATP-dependent serine protease